MEYLQRVKQAFRTLTSTEAHPNFSGAGVPHGVERASVAASRTDGGFTFEPGNKLQEFRLLVGISSDSSFLTKLPKGYDPDHRPTIGMGGRAAPNIGIYTTVVDKEIKARKNFKRFSLAINVCLGLQIIVAAAITALGAAKSNPDAVVVFGAINTVIAGFLTYLKGSGLPNRIKYYQHEWDKIREYIEARERDLMCSEDAFDIYDQIEAIRQMYEEVKNEIEANTPDRFVSAGSLRPLPETTAIRPGLSGRSSAMGMLPSDYNGKLSRMASSLSAPFANAQSAGEDEMEKMGDLEKGVLSSGHRTGNRVHDLGVRFLQQTSGLKGQVEDKIREMSEIEKQIESHGRAVLKMKEDEAHAKAQEVQTLKEVLATTATGAINDKHEEISRLEQEIEHRGRAIADLKAVHLRDSPSEANDFAIGPHDEKK